MESLAEGFVKLAAAGSGIDALGLARGGDPTVAVCVGPFHCVPMKRGRNTLIATVPARQEADFPHWKLETTGVIMPEESLPCAKPSCRGRSTGWRRAGGTIIPPLIMGGL